MTRSANAGVVTSSSCRARSEGRLARLPEARLSTAATSCPSASSRSTRCDPMNPAAPVTRMRTLGRLRLFALAHGLLDPAQHLGLEVVGYGVAAARLADQLLDDLFEAVFAKAGSA